jgi:hypothetical protein
MHRKRAEIGVLTPENHLLHRRFARADFYRLVRLAKPLHDLGQKACLVRVEREREALARTHNIADQLRPFRTHRFEPSRARVAVEDRRYIREIDRVVMHLALAELHQALDKASQTKTGGIDGHRSAS